MIQQAAAFNTGLYNQNAPHHQISNTAIARSEIEQQTIELAASADLIAQALAGLTSTLYQVLSFEPPCQESKCVPRPTLASPLGQALDDHNSILRSIAAQIEALRVRVQL